MTCSNGPSLTVHQDTVPPTPQAGPLPNKRGEIGYDDSRDITSERTFDEPANTQYPARHPAEDRPSAPSDTRPGGSLPISLPPSKYSVLTFLRSKKSHRRLGGLSAHTFARIIALLITLAAIVLGWYFSVKQLQRSGKSSVSEGEISTSTSSIFVHGVFGISAIILLVVLERTAYVARAERWSYLNPAELQQRQLMSGTIASSIPFAPWNRPPLPSYAAALGFTGTGDVEDDIIAAPPPPAYGNTRGSTLLLKGISLSRSGSVRSQSGQSEGGDRSRRSSGLSTLAESIRMAFSGPSKTEQQDLEAQKAAQGKKDMMKTLILSETLAKLENSNPTTSRR